MQEWFSTRGETVDATEAAPAMTGSASASSSLFGTLLGYPAEEKSAGAVDASLGSTPVLLEVATLNLGGRNSNAFEFNLLGDESELGQKWRTLYTRGEGGLTRRGPADFAGLVPALKQVLRVTSGTSRAPLPDVVAVLVACPTWEAMLAAVVAQSPKAINALNRMTLAVGRPSPLEQPSNLFDEAHSSDAATGSYLLVWLEWLRDRMPTQRALWEQRLQSKDLPPLAVCTCALLLFDAMCVDTIGTMHAPLSFASGAFLEHSQLHHELAFTSFEGKYTRLAAVLAAEGYPAIVCVQEAGPLVGPGAKELVDAYYFFVAKQETALLLRKGVLKGKPLPEALWRPPLEAAGAASMTANTQRTDWASCLNKTVVVCTRCAGVPILAVAVHGKANDVTPLYLEALKRVLHDAVLASDAREERVPLFPGHGAPAAEALVVVGVDANCVGGKQAAFAERLDAMGMMHTAEPASKLTVRKQRTRFQTQLTKLQVDASHKDWVLAWTADAAAAPPRLGAARYMPDLNEEMLLPTSAWPFDHSMVLSRIHLKPLALELSKIDQSTLPDGASTTDSRGDTTRPSSYSFPDMSAISLQNVAIHAFRPSRWTFLCYHVERNVRYGQILLMTLTMGYLEINQPTLLLLMAASGVLILSIDLLGLNADLMVPPDAWRVAVVILVWGVLLGSLLLMQSTMRLADRMEKFAPKFHLAFESLGLSALSDDELGPASLKPNTPARQEGVGAESLEALMTRAAALLEPFQVRIIGPLRRAGGQVEEPRAAHSNLKTGPRTYEKIRIEYKGDHTLVKDLLRGCIISPTIEDLCVVFYRFRELATKGVCDIVQIKNRYRDGRAPSGYADVNMVVRFEGHLCEVQLLLEDFYKLKNEQTPIYEFCRKLGLVGALPPVAPTIVTRKDVSCRTRSALGVLRFSGGLTAWIFAFSYITSRLISPTITMGYLRDELVDTEYEDLIPQGRTIVHPTPWGMDTVMIAGLDTSTISIQPRVADIEFIFRLDRVLHAFALATPYLIVAMLCFRDHYRFNGRCRSVGSFLTVSVILLLGYGPINNPVQGVIRSLGYPTMSWLLSRVPHPLFGPITSYTSPEMIFAIFYLVGGAVTLPLIMLPALLWSLKSTKPRRQSRVGLLYERYLGLIGEYYEFKVLAAQFLIVILQAPLKLPKMGAAYWANTEAVASPAGKLVLDNCYWSYMIGLVANCTYPLLLLLPVRYAKSVRIACATFDATLDYTYSFCFVAMMLFVGSQGNAMPANIYSYTSNFMPVLHICSVARSIESAARRTKEQKDRVTQRSFINSFRRRAVTAASDAPDKSAHSTSQNQSNAAQIDSQPKVPPATLTKHRRVPCIAVLLYVATTLGLVVGILYGSCRDRYPLATAESMRPCNGDESTGMLVDCRALADLKLVRDSLNLRNRGIRSITPGAFRGLDNVASLQLSYNDLTRISPLAFDGLGSTIRQFRNLTIFLEGNALTQVEYPARVLYAPSPVATVAAGCADDRGGAVSASVYGSCAALIDALTCDGDGANVTTSHSLRSNPRGLNLVWRMCPSSCARCAEYEADLARCESLSTTVPGVSDEDGLDWLLFGSCMLPAAKSLWTNCRHDICHDNDGLDLCCAYDEGRACGEPGFMPVPGGVSSYPACPRMYIYQCCPSEEDASSDLGSGVPSLDAWWDTTSVCTSTATCSVAPPSVPPLPPYSPGDGVLMCAPPSEGACRENGGPDNDCCANAEAGSCAAGYDFSNQIAIAEGGTWDRPDSEGFWHQCAVQGKVGNTCCTPRAG